MAPIRWQNQYFYLKFYNAVSYNAVSFFSKFFKTGRNLDNSIVHRLYNFSQFHKLCRVVKLGVCTITISENNNFILQVWSKILARNPRELLSPVENLGNLK